MAPPKLVFCLTCLFLKNLAQATNSNFSSSHHQEKRFASASVGESLTLPCNHKNATRFYWYKQTLREKPKLIATKYVYSKNTPFDDKFKNKTRFRVNSEIGDNHLHITDLQISDSGTYYCAKRVSINIEFAEGITINVKGSGSEIKPLIHRSTSETIQLGGTVTLNCTVHAGTWDGQHSVYWFKNSEEPHQGLIYTHRGRNDQYDPQTHTCVYNLPMKSPNLSHDGTYYCAVASCGHILFGNGTKLDFEDEGNSLVLVCFLSGALTVTIILIIFLAVLLYKMRKRNSYQSEPQARFSAPSTEGNRDADNLHYAALSVNLPNGSRRQKNDSNTECVYSSVKL